MEVIATISEVEAMAEEAMRRGESLEQGPFIHLGHSEVFEKQTMQVYLLSVGLLLSQLLCMSFESFR